MDSEVEQWWTEFKSTGSAEARNRLVLQYSPLVKYVAGRVRGGLSSTVDSSDLVSEGVIGLLDAIDKFEPERGWTFQTYAVPRIRGAMLDSVRAADWVPRSIRSRARKAEEVRTELRAETGSEPSAADVAAAVGCTLAELREVEQQKTATSAEDEELAAVSVTDTRVEDALEDEATREILLGAVGTLPERDRIIVALYFFEGLTLGEIGQVLGVTESRVSQLRTRAMKSLRDGLDPSAA